MILCNLFYSCRCERQKEKRQKYFIIPISEKQKNNLALLVVVEILINNSAD